MATRSVIWVILMTERSVRRCQGWRIQQGRGFDGDSGAYLANFESGVDRGSAIGLDDDGRDSLRFETVVREGEGIRADGEVYKIVAAGAGGFLRAGKLRAIRDDGDSGVSEDAAGGVCDGAADAAECLLRGGQEAGEVASYNNKEKLRRRKKICLMAWSFRDASHFL
jgi:hypothetical protein